MLCYVMLCYVCYVPLCYLMLYYLTANGFSPGGSSVTVRSNTQNNTPRFSASNKSDGKTILWDDYGNNVSSGTCLLNV
jgi:hypothetical protein